MPPLELVQSKITSKMCANAEVIITKKNKVGLDKNKCQNKRRYNSKYCQECSDAHNKN